MPTLSGYHPWIGTCARTTIESGLKINDRSFTTITYSKGCHHCVHTRIAHIMSRTKFFEVMNAQGRRMIQCDKFGYFDTCLKSGSKTTLQQKEMVRGFHRCFGAAFGVGTMESSTHLLSDQSTRVSISIFLSIIFFRY
jgi:hypothetical protein